MFNYPPGLTVGARHSRHGAGRKEKKPTPRHHIPQRTMRSESDYRVTTWSPTRSAKVQRSHNFAVVDKVDSILIDDARTPLIISGQGRQSTGLKASPPLCQNAAPHPRGGANERKTMTRSTGLRLYHRRKAKTATLAKRGKKTEQFMAWKTSRTDNITIQHHQSGDQGERHHAARYRLRRARRQVIIVDKFTGRR